MTISIETYYNGRDTEYAAELTPEIVANARLTVARINQLLERAGRSEIDELNSGWRPKSVNDATSNSATGSKHLTAEAGDIPDSDRALARWCYTHQPVLEEIGLWMEHPGWTRTWVHVQIVPPKSGHRCYIPNSSPPSDPSFGTVGSITP